MLMFDTGVAAGVVWHDMTARRETFKLTGHNEDMKISRWVEKNSF